MISVDNVLRSHTLLAGFESDGHTVLVAAAYHLHVASAQAQIAGVDVGRDVDTGKVADVYGSIGIWESGGD